SDAQQLLDTVPGQASTLISESIAGVVSRHREIHSIVVVDADGRALSDGPDEPGFGGWILQAAHGADTTLRFGPARAMADGRLVLPLALPMPGDGARVQRWILTRLYADELQSMVDG